MDLQRRLLRLSESRVAVGAAQRSLTHEGVALSSEPGPVRMGVLDELRAMIQRAESRGQPRPPLEAAPTRSLPGDRLDTAFGSVRTVGAYLPPDHHHGRTPIDGALQVDPEVVAMLALDPSLGGIDWSKALYLDTETTGLSGGTGTLPFLVGCAWFEDQSLRIEQLFLETPADESALLERLRVLIEAASCLVTYNGKAFDWPLLFGRYVMTKLAPPPTRPHLDLLHVARRCWRRRLGGVRLVQIEEQILGMRRERDIDGAEIPGLYWSFLRHRDGTSMLPVLEHNTHDLIALAALLGFVADRGARIALHDDPSDHLGLAEVAMRAGARDRALLWARAAAEGGGAIEVTTRATLLWAELLGRKKQYRDAIQALDLGLESVGRAIDQAAPLHLALAKLWEHRLKDPTRAMIHARGAASAEGVTDHRRRLARLEKKLERLAALAVSAGDAGQGPRRRGPPKRPRSPKGADERPPCPA